MKSQNQEQRAAERWQQIKVIVAEALEQPSGEAQAAFVKQSCGNDTDLLAEVSSLLEQTTGSLENFAQSTADSLRRQMSILVPDQRVGAYRILHELGRGGMGAVYLAERADGAFEKQVAIKVLKRGTDTDEVLRRFSGERQILARLTHPNIGVLLDAGTTKNDLPYFVMEFVDGKPITKYADQHKLSVSDRLKLFREVCSAVSYAHQHLVIHRDLKPTNVLVTSDGGIKLLDFGIAKLVDESTPEVTVAAQRRMTPEYASPEQVRGDLVTTVSDVYSLGVLLYELLTGGRPYKLKTRSADEITEAICEQEPERPSTAMARSIPDSRFTIHDSRMLRGDLDNIVLKALCKEPARRYASVDQFSEDIRRYLEGLPVRARKGTAAYRASKFIRRHRLAVAATIIVTVAVIAGSITTAWEAYRARLEKARAERRFNEVRKIANSLMLEFHNSIKDLPGALAARQLVTRRAVEYLDSLAQEAGNDLSLKSELAEGYEKIGIVTFDVQQAIDSHRKAASLNESLVRADPKNVIYLKQLSESYSDLSDVTKISGDSAGAVLYAKKSLAIVELLAQEKPSDRDVQIDLADRHLSLGSAFLDAGRCKEALESESKAMEPDQTIVAQDPTDQEAAHRLAGLYGATSEAYEYSGDHSTALDYARKEMAMARSIFQTDPSSARHRRDMWSAYFHLGQELSRTGDLTGARESYAQATELIEGLSSADPTDRGHRRWLAITYFSMADLLAQMDQPDKSINDNRKAIAISEQLVASDIQRVEARRDLVGMYQVMSVSLLKLEQNNRALETLNKALSLAQENAKHDPQNARVRSRLAAVCSDMGNLYRKLAEQRSPDVPKHAIDLRGARDWFQRSFEIWQDLKIKGTLGIADAAKPDEIAQEIAKCDAALAR